MPSRKPPGSLEQRHIEQRRKRLTTYPPAFFSLIDAAKTRSPATAVFTEHNKAVACQMRYYRFRIDAIEDKVPFALSLRDMQCTGKNGDGTLFNSRRSDAPGPYILTWNMDSSYAIDLSLLDIEPALPLSSQEQPTPQQGIIRPLGDQSESEKLVERMYGKGRNSPTALGVPDGTVGPRAETETLDVDALDLSSSGEQPPPCPPHEADELIPGICIKCRKPMQ